MPTSSRKRKISVDQNDDMVQPKCTRRNDHVLAATDVVHQFTPSDKSQNFKENEDKVCVSVAKTHESGQRE